MATAHVGNILERNTINIQIIQLFLNRFICLDRILVRPISHHKLQFCILRRFVLQDKLLKKGMVILREFMKNDLGECSGDI